MDNDPAAGWAAAHYALGKEQARLSSGPGLLEFERTKELLRRYLPTPPARIADVGAGTGAYSFWLHESLYRVAARDLAPLHIEQLRATAEARGALLDIEEADARDLDLADSSMDAVLLLGPLYHLRERSSRVRCLREAARVVRPGGVIVASAISRWSVLLNDVLRQRIGEGVPNFTAILDDAMETGMLEPLEPAGFTAFCARPNQLIDEANTAGLRALALLGVEGPGAYLPDLQERWNDAEARTAILDVARRLESVPEMLGVSPHLLLVASRP